MRMEIWFGITCMSITVCGQKKWDNDNDYEYDYDCDYNYKYEYISTTTTTNDRSRCVSQIWHLLSERKIFKGPENRNFKLIELQQHNIFPKNISNERSERKVFGEFFAIRRRRRRRRRSISGRYKLATVVYPSELHV